MKHTLTIAGLVLLTACNGSGNGVVTERPPVGNVETRLDRADTMRDRVLGYAGTSFDAIPDTNTADFKGLGRATIDRNGGGRGDDVNLVGFVQMTADFEDQTISGDMTNIQGHTGRTPRAGNVFDADGRIRIGSRSSELEFLRNGPTNRWTSDYIGTLDTPEGEIDLRGTLDGRFRGTRLNAAGTDASIRSIFGSDDDGRASVDGDRANGLEFEVFGLND